MNNSRNQLNHSVVRIKLDNDEYDELIVKMIKASSKMTVISESSDELVVQSIKTFEPIKNIVPNVNLIKIEKKHKNRIIKYLIDISTRFTNLIRHNKNDYTKIICISGFFMYKQ